MKNVEWIIVGLGNPEERHLNNRHNIGFICVDRLASRETRVAKKAVNRLFCEEGSLWNML